MFYLDDGILGGSSKDVISDLKVLEERARHIGLVLNHSKAECICKDPSTRDQLLAEFPSVCNTIPEEATLLGSPIGGLVRLHVSLKPLHSEALQMWKSLSPTPLEPPIGANTCHQKHWDLPLVKSCFSSLISAADSSGRICLLASQQKEAGAWLCAPPVSSLGLRMCNDGIWVAVGLRLGVSLCTPHLCSMCKSPVDASGVHGLSCRMSKGRLPRQLALNNIIHRALSAANIPSTLVSRELCRLHGKRPDGLTITPWSKGRALVWDVTCWDSFAASNVLIPCRETC